MAHARVAMIAPGATAVQHCNRVAAAPRSDLSARWQLHFDPHPGPLPRRERGLLQQKLRRRLQVALDFRAESCGVGPIRRSVIEGEVEGENQGLS